MSARITCEPCSSNCAVPRFWVGGTGTWGDTSHWSTVSGGPGGASVPTATQDAIFDASSFTAAGQHIDTANTTIAVHTMDWRAVTHAPQFGVQSYTECAGQPCTPVTINGSLYFNASVVTTWDNWMQWTFAAPNSVVIDDRNVEIANVFITGTGTFQLASPLQVNGNTPFQAFGGTFLANGNNVEAGSFQFRAPARVDLGSATWTTMSQGAPWEVGAGVVLMASQATLNIYDRIGLPMSFTGGGNAYHDVTLTVDHNGTFAGPFQIADSNSFDSLTLQSQNGAGTISVAAGTTQTIMTFSAQGTSSAQLTLQSTTAGSPWTLRVSGSSSASYVTVQDSVATGAGTPIVCSAETDCTGTNDTGWIF
jgi:hypothetical protein